MKTLTTSFYTVSLSVTIGLAVAMMFDVYIGTVVSFAVGAMTELTFSEMEDNKKRPHSLQRVRPALRKLIVRTL